MEYDFNSNNEGVIFKFFDLLTSYGFIKISNNNPDRIEYLFSLSFSP